MKVRSGFVTNSSSTNFLILTNEELTLEKLYNFFGFTEKSILINEATELCNNILNGIDKFYNKKEIDNIDYEKIKDMFGKETAEKYKKYVSNGYKVYLGYTSSGEDLFTDLFTMSSFEIEKDGIYINARECTW